VVIIQSGFCGYPLSRNKYHRAGDIFDKAEPFKEKYDNYSDVLRVSLPLVASMSTTMVMEFTDLFWPVTLWNPLRTAFSIR